METRSLPEQMAALPESVKQAMGKVAENFREEGHRKGISAGRRKGRSYRIHQLAGNMIQTGYAGAEICVILQVTSDYLLSVLEVPLQSQEAEIADQMRSTKKNSKTSIARYLRKQGWQSGFPDGFREGVDAANDEIARNMLRIGYSAVEICGILEVSNDYLAGISTKIVPNETIKGVFVEKGRGLGLKEGREKTIRNLVKLSLLSDEQIAWAFEISVDAVTEIRKNM